MFEAALLVAPVGGDAELGAPVHLLGAHLDLDRLAARSDDRRVQRLVEVELGRVDVVLEAALDRGPERVDRPEHRPAVALLVDDDAQAHQVEDLVELLAADDHLLVDAPEVLRSAPDLGLDPEARRAWRLSVLHDLGEVGLALGLARGDHLLDLGVALGVQRREAEVLELPLDLLDAEAVRERARRRRGSPGRSARWRSIGMTEMVRMLCSRSASLISRTRQSWAMAMNILRIVAACWASLESNSRRSSLVTPSTTAATLLAELAAPATAWSTPVSSTASCSRAAAMVVSSRPRSATMPATAIGWVT